MVTSPKAGISRPFATLNRTQAAEYDSKSGEFTESARTTFAESRRFAVIFQPTQRNNTQKGDHPKGR
jgi:hypothetical protein